MGIGRRMPEALLFFLVSITSMAGARPPSSLARDLQAEWLVFRGNEYVPYADQKVNAIYLNLDGLTYRGDSLLVQSDKPFSVFVDRKLIGQCRGVVTWSIDSLTRLYSPVLAIAIFQRGGIRALRTEILVRQGSAQADGDRGYRPMDFFLNFLELATLLLAVYFVLLFRTNPRLTLDYLNVSKFLSLHEREETLMATRVGSSVNLLFYLFGSASCGLVLLTIFHTSSGQLSVASDFPIRSTADGFLQWGKVTVLIMSWLALKLVVIYIFAALFHLRESYALQFFNFMRMLFMVIGLLAVSSVAYFIYYGYPAGPHAGWLIVSLTIMALSVVMIFLKLLTSSSFSFFHLFSYLCASEIIPLVILLKILLP
jgi:hypothetical protein